MHLKESADVSRGQRSSGRVSPLVTRTSRAAFRFSLSSILRVPTMCSKLLLFSHNSDFFPYKNMDFFSHICDLLDFSSEFGPISHNSDFFFLFLLFFSTRRSVKRESGCNFPFLSLFIVAVKWVWDDVLALRSSSVSRQKRETEDGAE